jgi:hypothetical protein
VLDAGGVEVVPHHLSSIVDADDLSPAGSREVHVAEDAAIVRKAAQHAHQVEVQPNHQTSPLMPVATLKAELGTVRIW